MSGYVIIIPARMESKRFPGKPLVQIKGRSLLAWTVSAAKSTSASVVVASPDDDILEECRRLHVNFFKSQRPASSGTERCFEAWEGTKHHVSGCRYVVNWQVDEPMVNPSWIDRLVSQPCDFVSTIVTKYPIGTKQDNMNLVKAVCSNGSCHWFSRCFLTGSYAHVGVYSFRVSAIPCVRATKDSLYSELEELEQLAWIEGGLKVQPVFFNEYPPVSVNAPDDVLEIEKALG